jgi:RimJ/RimL family protein N-acetyltransferase
VKLINEASRVLPWVMERTQDNFPRGAEAALGAEIDGELVAGVVYDHYTGPCVTATIAIDHKNLPLPMIDAMFRYPFEQLEVEKIIVYVNSANIESLELARRLGFDVEAEIVGVYPDGDMLILSLYKDECKWLEN